VWHTAIAQGPEADGFLSEVAWREFNYHQLYANPDMPEIALRAPFREFPWLPREELFEAWKAGMTGYPLVDAGMRELAQTGFMHNRVRMVAASFLCKHLLIPWQWGACWFWDQLVDADLASNSGGWQWVAGCGLDAAPYFRVFNPITQSEKFDPQGAYLKQWVPELSELQGKSVHKPWLTPLLAPAYPAPIVDHAQARQAALAAWDTIRAQSA
jgi:deoxyribodipyrimidine photo-lyase